MSWERCLAESQCLIYQRLITFHDDTDICLGCIYFIYLLYNEFWVANKYLTLSKYTRYFEAIFITEQKIKISPRWVKDVYHSDLSCHVSDCTVDK